MSQKNTAECRRMELESRQFYELQIMQKRIDAKDKTVEVVFSLFVGTIINFKENDGNETSFCLCIA